MRGVQALGPEWFPPGRFTREDVDEVFPAEEEEWVDSPPDFDSHVRGLLLVRPLCLGRPPVDPRSRQRSARDD